MIRSVTRHTLAWVSLAVALGAHVADEAAHHFLSFYSPLLLELRTRRGFEWLPPFRFDVWLGALIAGVVLLLALGWLAHRGARWLLWASIPFGTLMAVNGLLHMGGSLYYGRLLAGTWTAPLLIVCGAWLVWESVRDLLGYS